MFRALIRLSGLAALAFVNQPAQSQIKIVEQPLNTAISGRVIDEDGTPVKGAEITLQHYQPVKGRSQKITTAPNGAFTIPELPSGEYASCVTVPKTDYVDDCLWGLNFPPQIVPGVAATPGQAAKAP